MRLILPLMAVRAGFILVQYGCGLVLLAVWPAADAAAYATAVGASSWLFVVARSGPEKTALLLVPRARRTRPDLLAFLRPLVVVIPLPFAAAAAVSAALSPSSLATLCLAAASYYVALGSNLFGVAVHRALGRPVRDLADYLALTAGPVVFAFLGWRTGLSPLAYLAGQTAYVWLLSLTLLRGLTSDGPSHPPVRRSVRRLLAGNMVLLSVSEVLMNLGTSLLYAQLWVTGRTAESADLYRVAQGWTVVIAFTFFLQRIFQPRLSLRLAGQGAVHGLNRSRDLTRVAVLLSVGWLSAAGVLLALDALPGGPLVELILLVATRAPVFLLANQGVYLLENAGGARLSAGAAALGLVAVVATGAVTVPLFGAAGAVYALGAKDLATGVVMLRALAKRSLGRAKAADIGRSPLSH